jgi:uncharacterized Fe-S cluster protein YjdI
MDPKDIRKEYNNGQITVVWQPALCVHCYNCVRTNPLSFQPGERPWIKTDLSSTEKIIKAVDVCPSGALSYYINKEEKKEEE